jgi:hypothetical protein
MTDFWHTMEPWCCLKHFLKAEGNGKETLDKAVRDGGMFDPEGGEMRNFLTAVENLECAVGHFEEFATKYTFEAVAGDGENDEEKLGRAKFYRDMLDSTRYVRQKMIKSAGKDKSELMKCILWTSDLIDMLVDFMKDGKTDGMLEVDELD